MLVGGIVLSDVGLLRDGGDLAARARRTSLKGGLAAVALAGAQRPDPNYVPSQDSPQLTLGQYRELQDELAPPPADLTKESPIAQKAADDGLLRLGAIGVRPGGGVKGVPAIETVDRPADRARGWLPGGHRRRGHACSSACRAGGLSIQAGDRRCRGRRAALLRAVSRGAC